LVLVGELVTLWLEAFDSVGRPFPVSQYPYMDLKVQRDSPNVEIHRTRNAAADGQRWSYTVEGVSAGSVRVVFSSRQRSGVVIASSPQSIHVFSPLQVTPPQVLIVPGVSMQLQTHGGPPNSEVHFMILPGPDGIATVNSDGMVVGYSRGSAVVRTRATAIDSLTGKIETFGSVETAISVVTFNSLRIYTPSTAILAGEQISLRIVGGNGESPMAFGGSDIRVRWQTSNSDVAQLHPVYEHDESMEVTLANEASFTVHLFGAGSGITRISATIISAPESLGITGFSTSIAINVLERLELLSPPAIIMMLSSRYAIQTNRDGAATISYSVMNSAADCAMPAYGRSSQAANAASTANIIATIDATGTIHAGTRPGTVFIVVQDSAIEQQALVVKVEVRPIEIVQLLVASEYQTADSAVYYSMPIGSVSVMKVTIRDQLGREFHAVDPSALALAYTVDQRDSVAVVMRERDRTLLVRALRPGNVVLHVSLGPSDSLQDFIKIRVGNSIQPASTVVHLGATVHYSISHTLSGMLTDANERDSPADWQLDELIDIG
jgi:hypothetical protein